MPKNRVNSDTRKMVVYYRQCHEGKRIVFGGRVAISESSASKAAPDLHKEMCRIFPELANTKISHSWMGFVGYTFNSLPHLGVKDGIHYSMGYCGSGVSLASYFGKRIGQRGQTLVPRAFHCLLPLERRAGIGGGRLHDSPFKYLSERAKGHLSTSLPIFFPSCLAPSLLTSFCPSLTFRMQTPAFAKTRHKEVGSLLAGRSFQG